MKRMLAALALALSLGLASPALAHNFWINLNESFAHPPGHVTTLLGFGHVIPMDDLLTGDHGVIRLRDYSLVGPDGRVASLGLPSPKAEPKQKTPLGLVVQGGDLGLRKITLTGSTQPGTYQVAAQSQPTFFTMYLDPQGKKRMSPKTMDTLPRGSKVLASMKYQSFAKAFFAVKQWSDPKPLGHDLELMPLTDLSRARAGQVVRFKVTFRGKPVTSGFQGIETMTCTSNTFGGPDRFQLSAYLMDGVAQFRLPSAGQWVANVYIHRKTADDPGFKDLQGKCTDVYIAGAIGFTVKP